MLAKFKKQEDYEQFKKDKIVVVKFSATWCKACKKFNQNFINLRAKYPNIYYVDLDVDDYDYWEDTQDVNGVPTVKIFDNGELVKTTSNIDEIAAYVRWK